MRSRVPAAFKLAGVPAESFHQIISGRHDVPYEHLRIGGNRGFKLSDGTTDDGRAGVLLRLSAPLSPRRRLLVEILPARTGRNYDVILQRDQTASDERPCYAAVEILGWRLPPTKKRSQEFLLLFIQPGLGRCPFGSPGALTPSGRRRLYEAPRDLGKSKCPERAKHPSVDLFDGKASASHELIEQILLMRFQFAHRRQAGKDHTCFGGIHVAAKRISGNRLAPPALRNRHWNGRTDD